MAELKQELREEIEDCLFSAHIAADQYLSKGKPSQEKMLKLSVDDALEVLISCKKELQNDDCFGNYKLHLFVPLQLIKLLEMRKEKQNAK